jgi:hypothetical protein
LLTCERSASSVTGRLAAAAIDGTASRRAAGGGGKAPDARASSALIFGPAYRRARQRAAAGPRCR